MKIDGNESNNSSKNGTPRKIPVLQYHYNAATIHRKKTSNKYMVFLFEIILNIMVYLPVNRDICKE